MLYHNSPLTISKAIDSIIKYGGIHLLFLIDNSSNDTLKVLGNHKNIKYVYNSSNLGFGAAHNIAINLAMSLDVEYHFIVNPDVYFDEDVVTPMVNYMASDSTIGMIMPKILNTDGSIQYLPKLLPNVFWMLRRKLRKIDLNYANFVDVYELRSVPKDRIYNAPILSGCFTLLSLSAIKNVGAYDDNFFMYFEDFDLSRRMHQKYRTIYFPEVAVFHGYERGAGKNAKLFKIFIASAVTYFNKWGWFFDQERKHFNKQTIEQFEK